MFIRRVHAHEAFPHLTFMRRLHVHEAFPHHSSIPAELQEVVAGDGCGTVELMSSKRCWRVVESADPSFLHELVEPVGKQLFDLRQI
jgi:hypothetical protein